MKRRLIRFISGFLVVLIMATIAPTRAFAYFANELTGLTLTDSNGNTVTVDDKWKEQFPYGTFAFDNCELVITEGGESGVIKVYRLGGTTGRATAFIQYVPTVVQINEDEYSYANAAGCKDVVIEVEDTQEIAWYQPIGKDPAPLAPSTAVEIELLGKPLSTGDDSEKSTRYGAAETGDIIYTLKADVEADEYQWYVLIDGYSKEIIDATERTLEVSAEYYNTYDFYCVYTLDGVKYGSDSAKGVSFVPEEDEELPQMPDDIVISSDPTYSPVEMEPKNPYYSYVFAMTFADGEWVKEIHVSSPDDNISEADKFGTFTIIECEGGSLYDSANTMALHICDDEAPESSELGFAVTHAEFDKSSGVAELTIKRTGGTQNMVSVEYSTINGTAVAGKDYSAVSGTVWFYADVDETTLEIPLVDDGIVSDERINFFVRLSNVLGGGEDGICTLNESMDMAEVSLYNTATMENPNLSTLLYDKDSVNVSGSISEAGGSIAPVDVDSITGNQVIDDTPPLVAEIGQGKSDIMPLTYTYSDYILFDRDNISKKDYDTNYWTEKMLFANFIEETTYDSNKIGYNTNDWKVSGGSFSDSYEDIVFSSASPATARLEIPGLEHRFSSVEARVRFANGKKASPWAAIQMVTNDNSYINYDYVDLTTDTYDDPDAEILKTFWSVSGNSVNGVSGTIKSLTLGTSSAKFDTTRNEATANLLYAYFTRRAFTRDLELRIYTANDEDSAPSGGVVLTENSGVYDSIRPTISIVQGEGGVTENGHIYVGSKLKIDIPNAASYAPAKDISGGATLDYAVYLTDSNGNIVARADGSDGTYYLTMDWDGLNNVSDRYTLNIVMTRKQTLTLNFSKSTDYDSQGNPVLSPEDAYSLFYHSNDDSVWKQQFMYGYSPVTENGSHFSKVHDAVFNLPGTLNDWSYTFSNFSTYEYGGLHENIQWVNFHRSPEDRIVFNGRTYRGNDVIWLTEADLASENLEFFYYHKNYLATESPMTSRIDRIGVYLDGNGNGRIDGYFNEETGYFVLDADTDDTFIMFLEDGTDYDESIFTPVKLDNGKYGQYFLKVFYRNTPRSLVPPINSIGDEKAQILPAFISSITDVGNFASLTEEQQNYRYIVPGQNRTFASKSDAEKAGKNEGYVISSDNLPMYGAEVTKVAVLDIPVGGDLSPVEAKVGDTLGYIWEPNYRGNLLNPFTDPKPIFIENSLAGNNIPIAKIDHLDKDGNIILEDGGRDKLNGYLGSFTANSAIALCVQEQTDTVSEIAVKNKAVCWDGVLPGYAMNRTVSNDLIHPADMPAPETVTIGTNNANPSSSYLMSQVNGAGDNSDPFSFDTSKEEGNDVYPEFNMNMNMEMPSFDFSYGDYVTVTASGNDVIFSVGLPIVGYNSEATHYGYDSNTLGPKNMIPYSKDTVMGLFDYFKDPKKIKYGDLSYDKASKAAKDSGKFAKSFGYEAEISISFAVMLTYSPLTNQYEFSKAAATISFEFEFRLQWRFTPCPLVYVYITGDVGLNLGASLEQTLHSASEAVPNGVQTLDKNSEPFVFKTKYKTLQLKFEGEMLIELFTDEDCKNKVTEIKDETFTPGYIKSSGENEMMVNLVNIPGSELPDTYYVRLTALEDTEITKLETVTKYETKMYFGGVEIEPEFFIEVGAGIGVEVLKFELYASFKFNALFEIGKYELETDKYESHVSELGITASVGFRLVFLMFNFNMDVIQYTGGIDYTEENSSWEGEWTFGGTNIRSLSNDATDTGVRVRLPGSTEYTQVIYSNGNLELAQDENGIAPMALNPTNTEEVPFQLSGYGSSGDAFKLADGLTLGYDYKVVQVGDINYVVYTISRTNSDSLHPMDYSVLAMSKLNVTNQTVIENNTSVQKDVYGLVNPITGSGKDGENYIIVDVKEDGTDDGTGDLDFDVWVENDTIHVAWVSYADPGDINDINGKETNEDTQAILADAAANTIVKTAAFNPNTGFTPAKTVSGNTGNLVFLPNFAGEDIVVYGKAIPFEKGEQEEKEKEYESYLELVYPGDGVNAGLRDYHMNYQHSMWDAHGKGSKLCVSANGKTFEVVLGTEEREQSLENVEAVKIDDDYYVAYTTSEKSVQGEGENADMLTIRRLFLRKLNPTAKDESVFDDALILRTVYDYERNIGQDGVYNVDEQDTVYNDPYFANLQFLTGKLGGIKGTTEEFTVQAMSETTQQTFLLFEMNGSTYVIPQSSLESISSSHEGEIIPFFTPDLTNVSENGTAAQTRATTGRAEVTIGADSAGNIAAVYVSTVPGTTNNAIYLTKWDPDSATWGAGVMLAMNYMQVYEDAAENGWSVDEIEDAYLGKRTKANGYDEDYNKGGMDRFVFSNLQIALGQKSSNASDDSDDSTLLVLTQGNMTYLTAAGDNVVPMSNDDALAAWNENTDDKSRKPGVGIYAISYGAGHQSIGQSYLAFSHYDFTVNSALNAKLSFVNTGDVAIRAGENNPITVTLWVKPTDKNAYDLASWEIGDPILSGQKVELYGYCNKLTESLPKDSVFYFTVEEDEEYIKETGGTAFKASTLGDDEGNLKVDEKVELALEDVNIVATGVDDKGNTILSVEFTATNRGNLDAEETFVYFSYGNADNSDNEEAQEQYLPMDISNNTLNVSEPALIQLLSVRNKDDEKAGILNLSVSGGIDSHGKTDYGDLPKGTQRTIKGTITVSPDYFRGMTDSSLDLHLEIFSKADDFNNKDTATSVAEHNEYHSNNNVYTQTISQRTFFTSADNLEIALGTKLHLPISYVTTNKDGVNLLVEEVVDEKNPQRDLGTLYYSETGDNSGMLVIIPSKVGTGVIHLKDTNTNTIDAIAFEVVGTGDGIDIYKDNNIFTFYNENKTVYDEQVVSDQDWSFKEDITTWGEDDAAETPMRSNLAEGKVGSYFTFTTMAESIKLYFNGTIEVSSSFPDFQTQTFTGTGGSVPVDIEFGENPNNTAYTVTIKVKESPAGYEGAQFDRMTESYSQVHAYGDPVFNWAKGYKSATATFTCLEDKTHTEIVEATVTSAVKTPATCKDKGITTYTATVDFNDKTYTDTKDVTDIPLIAHTPEIRNAKKALCLEDGYTGDTYCSVCGELLEKGEVIPATGHHFENGKCVDCGVILGDVDLDGVVTVKDATLIQMYCAYFTNLSKLQLSVADVNFSGDINVKDATQIQMYLAKFISEFTKS